MAGKQSTTNFKAKAKAKAKRSQKTTDKRHDKSQKAASKASSTKRQPPRGDVYNNSDRGGDKEEEESDEDVDMDEEDVVFLRENADSLSFLSSINPDKLKKVTKEAKPKRLASNAKPKVSAPTDLSESEDDEEIVAEDSDSDLEVFSSDEEGEKEEDEEDEDQLVDLSLSESESDVESLGEEGGEEEEESDREYRNRRERRALKRKAKAADLMNYEQEARSFEQREKKAKVSSKLPIKMPDGRLVLAEDAGGEDEEEEEEGDDDEAEGSESEPEAPESESGSESESEPYDEDEEEETEQQQPKAPRDNQITRAADGPAHYSVDPDRKQMTRKQYIIAQQNRLAAIADTVTQSPEGSAKSLRLLHHISEDRDVKVKQLGLLTQLAVYRDVLPDYRIRELTEKEKQMKVTKEVQQQRIYEESLVKHYGTYLKQLFAASKQAMKIFGDEAADIETGIVAARALGELVNSHPHFNYRKDILSALVDIYVQPTSRISFPAFTPMAQSARLAVLRLFRDDVSGEYSQNAVILASKRIKRLSYRVDPSALRPWLHLRLREELRENPEDRKRAEQERIRKEKLKEKQKLMKRKKGSAALNEAKRALHESKKQVKARKVQQEVDRSLRDAEAEVSREEREKWYGETLKQVFITYFRILKQKDNIGGLLPAVLEGLAKYAHLISVEFFIDLFHLLKKIMRGQHGVGIGAEDVESASATDGGDIVSSKVSLRTSLLCVLTALHILTGQGEALNLDIKEFFYQLYALIPPLAANPHIEATRLSTLSDGTRYTVYLTPADIAAANAARIGQQKEMREMGHGASQEVQLSEAMWEETVRSESDLLFECLELMFLGRTKVSSITRVASFCKRLAEGTLYWPPKTTVKALVFIHRLLIKYPALDRLLSSEEQAGSGQYLRDLDDPDMCNPFATCVYELHWLQIHHNASVRDAAVRLLEFAKAEDKKHRL